MSNDKREVLLEKCFGIRILVLILEIFLRNVFICLKRGLVFGACLRNFSKNFFPPFPTWSGLLVPVLGIFLRIFFPFPTWSGLLVPILGIFVRNFFGVWNVVYLASSEQLDSYLIDKWQIWFKELNVVQVIQFRFYQLTRYGSCTVQFPREL